jgi:hypothetical protein
MRTKLRAPLERRNFIGSVQDFYRYQTLVSMASRNYERIIDKDIYHQR